jgi:restriction endonuclease
MSPTERPTDDASEHQRIIRDTQQLRHLVQALSNGPNVNFRAIHEVASRIMQAAYDEWKKAELAKIALTRHQPAP